MLAASHSSQRAVAGRGLIDVHRAYACGLPPDLALQSAIRTHLASADRFREVSDWAPFFLSVRGRHSP